MANTKLILKKHVAAIIVSVIATLISTVIVAKCNGYLGTSSLTKEQQTKKAIVVLQKYAMDVNRKKFDAYKYFSPKIERYFQMFDTSPQKINNYVNDLFYKQFQNPNMHFDESTLSIKETDDEYEAMIIMYSTYYNTKEQKQYIEYRTRIQLKLDNDFKIKYFRQFYK